MRACDGSVFVGGSGLNISNILKRVSNVSDCDNASDASLAQGVVINAN